MNVMCVEEDGDDDKMTNTLMKKGFDDQDDKNRARESKPRITKSGWDLNELSPPEKLKLWMEEPSNKHICMMYKIYFPFVLGMSKTESERCMEDEGEIKEDLVDPIDLNLSPSLTEKKDSGAQVVDMMMEIYFPSMFW
ncbi:hypothetical protein ACET3Z_010822 [Daucus carota]